MSEESGAGEEAVAFDNVGMSYTTTKEYVHALVDITLRIERGHFVSILGPSGCGKSTLLMIAAGLRACTSGEVRFNGVRVNGPQSEAGIVFQNDALLDWRSALDNVLLQVELSGLRKRDYRDRAAQLLESVGLKGFESRRPYELSGGMRQRVALCRALVHDPPVLFMDEPFGALDALTRDQMMLDLQSLWLERQKTVIFVTHSIAEAIFLSDEVVVMSPRPGRIDAVIDVELRRPRTLDMTTEPEFNGYMHRIRQLFERRGVIHAESSPNDPGKVVH
jgi:NitT/TauT family transport system ATP-binding protein